MRILEIVSTSVSAGSLTFTFLAWRKFLKATKQTRSIAADYLEAILQSAYVQGATDSLADPIVTCGGCGEPMLLSESNKCPGNSCAHFKNF